jgi:3-deoxy-D-manno-octulosonic acid (KDO) 8-phosphate synthase
MAYREDVFTFAFAIEFKKTPVSAGVFSLFIEPHKTPDSCLVM